MSLRSKVTLSARGVAAVLAASGTAGTAIQQADKWDGNPSWLLWGCIGIPGAVAVADQVRLMYQERKAGPRAGRQEAVDLALVDALLLVSDITGYDKWGVGVTAWVVRRRGLRRIPVLERLARRRLTNRPAPSNIAWTKGKGIIGRCWELETEVHKDLRAACRKYPQGNITAERFADVSGDLRQGMSLDEFHRMIGKYGEVLAVPMKDKTGAFVGCIAVDIPIDRCDQGVARLGRVEVREVAATTAALVARVIGGE